MTKSAKVTRGLSIATTILSACALLSSFALMSVVTSFFTMASYDNSLAYSFYEALIENGMSYSSAQSLTIWLMNFGGTVVNVIVVISIILEAVMLIAGIVGIAKSGDPQKLSTVMVWAIVGASFSLVSFHFITLVLFILQAVFAHSAKKEAVAQQMGY